MCISIVESEGGTGHAIEETREQPRGPSVEGVEGYGVWGLRSQKWTCGLWKYELLGSQ